MGIVTCDISISLDGYSAGPNQSLDRPFGDGVEGGETLHAWMFDHADDHRDELAAITAAGAFVMGRNMFGPGRGAWDPEWVGWWGPEPPYHAPVYVLTHVEREPLEMEGGTTFHFVTGGPEEALALARAAAGDRNVAIAGGYHDDQPVPRRRRDRRAPPARRARGDRRPLRASVRRRRADHVVVDLGAVDSGGHPPRVPPLSRRTYGVRHDTTHRRHRHRRR